MNEYKKPYLILFNAITDATRKINENDIFMAEQILIKAQVDAEEAFIEANDEAITFLEITHNNNL